MATHGVLRTFELDVLNPLFTLNSVNKSADDSKNIGFAGYYNNGGTKMSGIFRDASDGGVWKLFNNFENVGNLKLANAHALNSIASAYYGDLSLKNIAAVGNAAVSGNLSVTQNAAISGALAVTQDATVSGNIFASNNATIGGLTTTDSLIVNTNATISNAEIPDLYTSNFEVTTLAQINALQVILDASIGDNLSVLNAAEVGSLHVNADAAVSGNLSVTQNAAISGALAVTQDATVSGNIFASNSATIGSLTTTDSLTVNANAAVDGSLSVNNAAEVGSIHVNANAAVSGNLSVTQNATLQGNLSVSNLAQVGILDVYSNANVYGTMTVGNTSYLNATYASYLDSSSSLNVLNAANVGSLSVNSNATVNGMLTTNANANIAGALTVSDAADVGGSLTVHNFADVYGTLTVHSDTFLLSNLHVDTGKVSAFFAEVSGSSRTQYLEVNVDATIDHDLFVSGNAVIAHLVANSITTDNLHVVVDTAIDGNLTVAHLAEVDSLDVNVNAFVGGYLSVNQNADISGNLSVTHAAIVSGDFTASQNATVSGNLSVAQDAAIAGHLSVANSSTLHDVSVLGDLTISGTLIALDAQSLQVRDNFIISNNQDDPNSTAYTIDSGFVVNRRPAALDSGEAIACSGSYSSGATALASPTIPSPYNDVAANYFYDWYVSDTSNTEWHKVVSSTQFTPATPGTITLDAGFSSSISGFNLWRTQKAGLIWNESEDAFVAAQLPRLANYGNVLISDLSTSVTDGSAFNYTNIKGKNITATGSLAVGANAAIGGNLAVAANADIVGSVNVTKDISATNATITGSLTVSGALDMPINPVKVLYHTSGSLNLTNNDIIANSIVVCNAPEDIVVTLPDMSSYTDTQACVVRIINKAGSNTVTVNSHNGATIEANVYSYVLNSKYDKLSMVSLGSGDWTIIG